MYYHFAVLLLFRPLIKLQIIGSNISPKDVCVQAADAIQELLRSYSQLYTLKRAPSFVPYFILASSIMHLAIGASSLGLSPQGMNAELQPSTAGAAEKTAEGLELGPRVTESTNRGIADLTEMAPCHHFAEQALSFLHSFAKKWNIDVEMASETHTGNEALVAGSGTRSATSILTPNVTEGDKRAGAAAAGAANAPGVPGSTTVAKAAISIENPLFWPFPVEGRVLPGGKPLDKGGFASAL